MSLVNQIKTFHQIIDQEASELNFGTMTVNVQLSKAVPLLSTLSVVKQRRRNYSKGPTIQANKTLVEEIRTVINKLMKLIGDA